MLPLISRIVIPLAVILAALGIYRAVAVAVDPPVSLSPSAVPTRVLPTNLEPRVASEDQMRQVLSRVLPPIDPVNTNNFVHALRLWGAQATFDDPALPSGEELRNYFLDDQVFRKWAGEDAPPLFERGSDGLRARDFDDNFARRFTSSYHNDDLLATLAETGTPLDTPMHLRDGTASVEELLTDSLSRFHTDRWEFEWSMISYLRYLYPEREWENKDGVKVKLGTLVQMCVPQQPSDLRAGPCNGEHRLEALVVLLKVDEQVQTRSTSGSSPLSPKNRQQLIAYLKSCSDKLVATQSVDGYWTANWVDGIPHKDDPQANSNEKILVTGHTLEWLALAPEEALPPRENIVRAGQWLAKEIIGLDQKLLVDHYGPYSHAARALSLWHGKEAWELWQDLKAKEAQASSAAPAN